MGEILRDFTIEFDLETGNIKSNHISFFITDKNISTIFVKLKALNDKNVLSYLTNAETSNHSLKIQVKKPKTNEKVDAMGEKVTGLNDEVAKFRFDLESKFTNQVGTYIVELLDIFTENGIEKQATSCDFKYKVKASQISDLQEEEPSQGSSTITMDTTNETLLIDNVDLNIVSETATI